jgi:hypothetical protein
VPGQRQIEDASPRVRVETVDSLPHGRRVARFEADHETVIAVAARLDEDVRAELEASLQEAVTSGMWQRHWRGPQ